MSYYIRPGTKFPKYYQFPEFLLRAPISQTAKLAYMVLYDRARRSLKNDWIADGKIYTVFPIAELAETLGKSQSTVKSVLNELDEAGLLIRKSEGFSKANILYVLIPSIGQFPDKVSLLHSRGRKKSPHEDDVSELTRDRISAPNKVIETNNGSKNNGVLHRTGYSRYKNIYLSQGEYDQLCRDYPVRMDGLIEEMSAYCAADGKAYQNCEAALSSWAEKDDKQSKPAKSGFEDYSCKEGESF